MKSRVLPPKFTSPRVNIHVSGKLFEGHLSGLDQVIAWAHECRLWPVLDLSRLDELDRAALIYLAQGEHRDFEVMLCPPLFRDWMEFERRDAA